MADNTQKRFDVDAIQSSHPFPLDVFPDWDRYRVVDQASRNTRTDYIQARLEELESQGVSLLYVCFSALPLAEQVDECVRALDSMGRTSFFVRLIERQEKPPPTDPSGSPFPESKEGALCAKVSQRYVKWDENSNESLCGTKRSAVLRQGKPLTNNVIISKKARSISLAQARMIWCAWGYRSNAEEFIFGGKRCTWLVAECDPSGNVLGS